jgi:hypothetical protein
MIKWWRRKRPTIVITQKQRWAREDAAFAILARDVLGAAAQGVDVSALLKDCPDLTALAVARLR